MSDDTTFWEELTAPPKALVPPKPYITYYPDLIQGSEEWHAIRCGLITASEMKLLLTTTFKAADNEKTRAHLHELAAQRVTRYVEPHYISDDMLRGQVDEIQSRELYEQHYKLTVDPMGFITSSKFGFTLGYSPDGLVGDNGLIECKSRRQKFQFETMVECVPTGGVPVDFILQLQTGLLVTEREWIDFISYSGGMPMIVVRVWPDQEIHDAIVCAAGSAEHKIAEKIAKYHETRDARKFVETERRVEQEIIV